LELISADDPRSNACCGIVVQRTVWASSLYSPFSLTHRLWRASNCQSHLAKAFYAALKVIRVLKRKDAAAAFNGKCRIELNGLFPGLEALRSSKVAIARSEQGMGDVRLRVACEPLLSAPTAFS